jgi:hypothetical protein
MHAGASETVHPQWRRADRCGAVARGRVGPPSPFNEAELSRIRRDEGAKQNALSRNTDMQIKTHATVTCKTIRTANTTHATQHRHNPSNPCVFHPFARATVHARCALPMCLCVSVCLFVSACVPVCPCVSVCVCEEYRYVAQRCRLQISEVKRHSNERRS